MTEPTLALTRLHRRGAYYWRYITVILLAFVFGSIAINMAATRTTNPTYIQDGFADGALETITPIDLAPWWLVARAQLDCQQLMPLASAASGFGEAISRSKYVLSDRKVNACTLLASVTERKRLSDNIREVKRQDGFHTAGSLTVPAISLMGFAATRWVNFVLLVASAVAGLWLICTTPALGGRRDRIAATVSMMSVAAFILAIPGSLTAMPTMLLLIASLVSVLILLRRHRAEEDTLYILAPLLAAALVSLDPMGGSVPVGMGCLLLLARMIAPPSPDSTAAGRAILLRTAGLYILTVALCWISYAMLVGFTDNWSNAFSVIRGQLTDSRELSRIGDFAAAAGGTYKWLSGENLLGPLGAFDLLFTVLFGLAFYVAVEPLHPKSGRLEPLATALIAISPVLIWAMLYPGYWRRAEEQYALPLMWLIAVALAGPFCLLIEFARRQARRRAKKVRVEEAISVA